MKGYIRSKGNHSWQIQVYTGKSPDGKPQRHFEQVRGHKGDAQRRLNELLVSLEKGIPAATGRITVADNLNAWL